jgi:hypothetical protein
VPDATVGSDDFWHHQRRRLQSFAIGVGWLNRAADGVALAQAWSLEVDAASPVSSEEIRT